MRDRRLRDSENLAELNITALSRDGKDRNWLPSAHHRTESPTRVRNGNLQCTDLNDETDLFAEFLSAATVQFRKFTGVRQVAKLSISEVKGSGPYKITVRSPG